MDTVDGRSYHHRRPTTMKLKVHTLKKSIGLFSGYVWVENDECSRKQEKQRTKAKERINKCFKEKSLDFCDILNMPVLRGSAKKEDLSAKLLEFLESSHATTEILLADKEVDEMKRRFKEIPEDECTKEVEEKIFTDILGREKGHGRVRTWGLGLSPTDIFGSTSSMTPCSDIIQSIVDEKVKMRMKEYEKQHTDKMNELEKQQKEKLEGLERTQRELNLIIEMYRKWNG